jgi:predicted AAA+ superfamily ATPase
MIARNISQKMLEMAGKFPVVTITGPRQSGKTTLIKHIFKNKSYVSLENPDTRLFVEEDPRGFLRSYPDGLVIDEAQRVPDLFSYIQGLVDEKNEPGQFILSGSQSFLLHHKISQTLAGRTAILRLLPFCIPELAQEHIDFQTYEEYIFTGSYPRIYDKNIRPSDFFPNYIQTYLERDVRSLQNIHDLSSFIRFLGLCAGRIGQILDLTSLANDCGISVNTAKAWTSVLEASYAIYLLQPYYKNYNKRLIKRPKIYFYDTGLACSLLKIESAKQLETFYNLGGLFENMIINEIIKQKYNKGLQPGIYFWRDNKGKEIDCLIDQFDQPLCIEIKASKTFHTGFFKNLNYWNRLSGSDVANNLVFYGGNDSLSTSLGRLISWKKLAELSTVLEAGDQL